MKKVFTIFTMFLILAFPGFAKAELPKIGIVDLQKVLDESARGREAMNLLAAEFEKKKKELDLKEEELEKIKDEITKRSSLWSLKVKQEKSDELEKSMKEYRRMRADLEEEMDKKNKNLSGKIMSDIIDLVNKLGEQENFSLILERGNAIFISSGIDITDKVIKLYNSSTKPKNEK